MNIVTTSDLIYYLLILTFSSNKKKFKNVIVFSKFKKQLHKI